MGQKPWMGMIYLPGDFGEIVRDAVMIIGLQDWRTIKCISFL